MRENIACRWLVNRTNPEYVKHISRLASVSPPFATALIKRGLKTPEQLNAFLNPDPSRLSNPAELPDIKIAVNRIREAKRRGEKILIYGDYDADGVTGTAIMLEGLERIGADASYFIPNRMTHGYGFSIAGVQKAKEVGASLIITVDCGITSFEAVSNANSLGIDVIITDHHEPIKRTDDSEQLAVSSKTAHSSQLTAHCSLYIMPEALAIVNPKLMPHLPIFPPSHHPPTLSGAGVAFKVIQYLLGGRLDDVYDLFDLAAIGTGADVVPVTGDNRIILKEGLKLIQSGQRAGIKALKDISGIRDGLFKTSHLYFGLIPRINAAGRIADASDVVRLLITKSGAEAEALARWLNDLNCKRQAISEIVYSDAKEMCQKMDNNYGAIVIASEGWHPGVVGIVASKIAEEYYRPTFILSIDNAIARGSARSIQPFDIHHGLLRCRDILKGFGGHKQAAGLSLLSENIEQFRTIISGIVRHSLSEEDLVPALHVDTDVRLSDINIELINEISRLEPFGYDNDIPLFGAKELEVIQSRVIGNNHLKMYLRQGEQKIDSIGFSFGGQLDIVGQCGLIDAVFSPVINEWNGKKCIQLNLKAIRPSI